MNRTKQVDLSDVEIKCPCDNELKATVIKAFPFELTCMVCERKFVETLEDGKVYFITGKDANIHILHHSQYKRINQC